MKTEQFAYETQRKIMDRWCEHFADLFDWPSQIDMTAIHRLPQLPIIKMLQCVPSIKEVQLALTKSKRGKAPGLDSISADLFQLGSESAVFLRESACFISPYCKYLERVTCLPRFDQWAIRHPTLR